MFQSFASGRASFSCPGSGAPLQALAQAGHGELDEDLRETRAQPGSWTRFTGTASFSNDASTT